MYSDTDFEWMKTQLINGNIEFYTYTKRREKVKKVVLKAATRKENWG